MRHALTVGVGKQLSARAPKSLGGALESGSGRRGECYGMGRCTGVGVEEEERRARNGGVGAVDGCSGVGRCTGVGVEEDERGERLARG